MKLNLKVRFKNPVFLIQLVLAILSPILAYAGLTVQDLTSWKTIGNLLMDAIGNPYVLILALISVWNALNDPTTKGIGDSINALEYEIPKGNE